MKPRKIDSDEANGCDQELWGELIGIDDRTDQERTFTVYKRSGSLLIVNDTGFERLAGPDHGLSKTHIFQEVMDQFGVHAVRRKSSYYAPPGWADAEDPPLSNHAGPHLKHSGLVTGRKILFLADVPVDAARAASEAPDDNQKVHETAERLAANLTCMAVTGEAGQPGEDEMRISSHSRSRMSNDVTERHPDAEKDGVRVWFGAQPE